jgi:hypothetical protein
MKAGFIERRVMCIGITGKGRGWFCLLSGPNPG